MGTPLHLDQRPYDGPVLGGRRRTGAAVGTQSTGQSGSDGDMDGGHRARRTASACANRPGAVPRRARRSGRYASGDDIVGAWRAAFLAPAGHIPACKPARGLDRRGGVYGDGALPARPTPRGHTSYFVAARLDWRAGEPVVVAPGP